MIDTEHCILCRTNPPSNKKGEPDQRYNTCRGCRRQQTEDVRREGEASRVRMQEFLKKNLGKGGTGE